MKDNKLKFSRIITIVSLVIFIAVLAVCFIIGGAAVDTTFFVTAISVSGGIAGVCIIWGLKRSQAVEVKKAQVELYKETLDLRLKYNEKMYKFRDKYGISEQEMEAIEDESPADDISDHVFDRGIEKLDEKADDADSDTSMDDLPVG